MKSWIYLAAAIATSASAADRDAETVDEVIVTANRPTSVGKLDAALRDLPQNVSVVTREVLDTFGKPRLEDLAFSTVGIQPVAPALGVTNYGFFVRGFNGAPVITDGYYSSVNAFGSVGIQDMSLFESAEVLRGPASLLYGQGNPGGIVNLRTKQPRSELGSQVSTYFDHHGARRVEGDVTGALSANADARLVGVFEDSDSHRDFVSHDRVLIAPSLAVGITDNVDLRLNYVYDRLDYIADNGPGTNPDLIQHLNLERSISEPWLPATRALNRSARVELDWQVSSDWTARVGYFAHTLRTPNGSSEIDAIDTIAGTTLVNRWYTQTTGPKNGAEDSMLTVQLLGKFATGELAHTFTAAIDYIDNRTKYDYEVNEIRPIDYLRPEFSNGPTLLIPLFAGEGAFKSYVKAAYMQDLVEISDRWKVLVGLRKDEIVTRGYADAAAAQFTQESDESAVTPRAGIAFEALPSLTLYGSFSEAFVPLIGTDRFNRPFEPEESRSFEIGARQQFGDSLLLTAAIFDIEKKNIIVVDPADTNFNVNAGVATSQGVEIEMAGRLTRELRVIAGLAFTDAEISESVDPIFFPEGDRLPAAAEWSALLGIRYEPTLLRGLELGGNVSYASSRPYVVPNVESDLDSYTRVDVYAAYALYEQLELQLNVQNVTNERVLLANGYGLVQFDTPRTYALTMRYKFGSLTR